ncbi:MAG TPA: hypothetical protein PKB10_12295 [Tepidisphaeraceae bacterium]|nr:hypothetical protein [Tepidisphaeraceae bacterium]
MQLPVTPASTDLVCKMCTIHLERLCYRRAWWFRIVRECFATGIRVFALIHRIRPADYRVRSTMCHGCIRFRKNALKRRSKLFNRLDARLNPLFNRIRDSLLTPDELDRARELARRAGDPSFEDGR